MKKLFAGLLMGLAACQSPANGLSETDSGRLAEPPRIEDEQDTTGTGGQRPDRDPRKSPGPEVGVMLADGGPGPLTAEPEPPKRPNFFSNVYGYVIVHGPNADSISAEVNQRLSRGFFLRGPLRVERTRAGLEYIQSMNREIH